MAGSSEHTHFLLIGVFPIGRNQCYMKSKNKQVSVAPDVTE